MGHPSSELDHFIFGWLAAIETTRQPETETAHQTKRKRVAGDIKRAKKPCRHTIPTPSLSSPSSPSASPTCKSNGDINNTHPSSGMPSPRKRTRKDSHENTAHYSDQGSYEETPKAKRQPGLTSRTSRPSTTGSTPSTSSITSGASSPTKQFRYAAKQDTGFQPLNFEPHLHSLPQPLRTLRQELAKIAFGEALVPRQLQQEVQELGDFPSFAFYDPTTSEKQWRIPSTDLVQSIVKRAAECDQDHEGESSWNLDVHARLLDFGFRQRSSSLVDFRYCTGAQILHEYKPYGASSKAVDFCVCIKPDASSAEAQAIEALTLSRPGFPINHTDWGNFNKHPIALSVETKRQAEWDRALLQIGTWHSSQWRALQRGSDAHMAGMGCLPGIIVQGHSWYFVASTVETGKAKLYHKLDIGGTDSHFRVYKLVVALQYLGEWIEGVYWPAFKQAVLSMAPTT